MTNLSFAHARLLTRSTGKKTLLIGGVTLKERALRSRPRAEELYDLHLAAGQICVKRISSGQSRHAHPSLNTVNWDNLFAERLWPSPNYTQQRPLSFVVRFMPLITSSAFYSLVGVTTHKTSCFGDHLFDSYQIGRLTKLPDETANISIETLAKLPMWPHGERILTLDGKVS